MKTQLDNGQIYDDAKGEIVQHTPPLWTINSIQAAMRERGSHWWDPDTMRYLKCKVMPKVYQGDGGIYFVSSEAYQEEARAYTVRKFDPVEAQVSTAGNMGDYRTKFAALNRAKRLAQGEGLIANFTAETHRPVSVLEQFIADLRKHGNATGEPYAIASELIGKAARHERYMVAQCNGEYPYGRDHNMDDGHPKKVEKCRADITSLAKEAGAKGVIFGGDPRGCTCKLTFADGFTNDFAKEGYCVPTSLKGE